MIYSGINLILMYNDLHQIPVDPNFVSRTLKKRKAMFRLFSLNAFLMVFFIFLPSLANLLFFFIDNKFLLNLISLSIFVWFLPVHLLTNKLLYPSIDRALNGPRPAEQEMELLE
jgi:hypothetical protein